MQATDNNNALLRLYYLQQLGIACYVPRVPLPGALMNESALTDEVPTDTSDVEVIARPLIAVDPEPAAGKPGEARQIVTEAPEPPQSTPPPSRKIDAAAVAPAERQAMPPFQILFAVVSAELAIAIQIPGAMKPVLRDADTKLLSNILRWLGMAWSSQLPLLQFHWPLPGLPATGIEQAGKGLQAFLHQAALERPFQRLVIFGGEPAQALRASGNESHSNWQVWYTHSLAELLALPALKHETWQTLIPLKAQLSS